MRSMIFLVSAVLVIVSGSALGEPKKADDGRGSALRDSNGRWIVAPLKGLGTAVPALTSSGFSTPAAVSELNTLGDDANPSISADGLTMYFSSDRTGTLGDTDIWMATRANRLFSFGTPTNLGSGVNSSGPEIQPTVTADGLEIFFTRSIGTWSSTDLYSASRAVSTDPLGAAIAISELNTGGADAYPYISPDALTLYFTSDRPGSTGDDIWYATRPNRTSAFGSPQLMLGVNSAFHDIAFSMRADGLAAYLASRRGGGDPDIYEATRISTLVDFGVPSLISTLAHSAFDSSPSITADGAELYFFSTRLLGTNYNIWRATSSLLAVQDWKMY